MSFFIIPTRHCLQGWQNWNEFLYCGLRIWDCGFYVKFAFVNPKSKIRIPRFEYASLAQLVEQLIRNEQVVGPDALSGASGVRMLTGASAFESHWMLNTLPLMQINLL